MKSFITPVFFSSFFLPPIHAAADSARISAQQFAQMASAANTVGKCSLQSDYIPAYPCGRGGARCGDRTILSIEFEDFHFTVTSLESIPFTTLPSEGLAVAEFKIQDIRSQDSCTTVTFPQFRRICEPSAHTVNSNVLTVRFDDHKIQAIGLEFLGNEQHPRTYREFSCVAF